VKRQRWAFPLPGRSLPHAAFIRVGTVTVPLLLVSSVVFLLGFALAEAEKGDFHTVVCPFQGNEADTVSVIVHESQILV
jgi:hypothetical protein